MSERTDLQRLLVAAALAAAAVILASAPATAQTDPVPGEFLGADLITEDAEAAVKFYTGLFNWNAEKAGDGYTFYHQGTLISSVSEVEDDAKIDRSFWLVGIAVENVDDALRTATATGATVFEKVTTVADYGRFAVIGDPQDAPVMLIEPGAKRIGGTSGPGAWAWAEFWTRDGAAAAAFYTEVIGYGIKMVQRDDEPYGVFVSEGKGRSGLVKIPDGYDKVEAGWVPYVGVSKLIASVGKVKELGGRVIFGGEETSGAKVALITDPVGGALFLYEIGTHEGGAK